ncbi:MAG: hypothetical protein Q7R42_02350 [Candidatus Planktophila sp.]|nr:hypothetical protein [Candidatus Planktophila sp.]
MIPRVHLSDDLLSTGLNIVLEVVMRPLVNNQGVGEFAGKKPLLRATKVSCPINDPPINM